MTHERALNSDSFSLNEEGQDFSQGNIERQEVLRRGNNRSDSPEFGYSGNLQRSDPMLIDDKMPGLSPTNKGYESKKGNRNPDEVILELKEKLKSVSNTLREQQEEHKGQLLHIETISMMTKYQLVFIKMESALIKVAHIIKNKDSVSLAQGFLRILQYSKTSSALRKYKTQLVYYNVKENTEKLVNSLGNLQKGALLKGFKAIWLNSKSWKTFREFKDEKDKLVKTYNEALSSKDREIAMYVKKIEDLNNLTAASKSKENDFVSKLKQKEKHIAALELEKVNILNSKKSISGDSTAISIKVLEERVRDLQQENEDLKEKLSSAESNVGTFIKEMSELLDSHELSINIGSDENASFNNPEIEEDFDSSAKIKDRGAQNPNRTKENQTKVLPQRAAYQSSQNRYPKIQHI